MPAATAAAAPTLRYADAPKAEAPLRSLLDDMLAGPVGQSDSAESGRLRAFREAATPAEALEHWLGRVPRGEADVRRVKRRIAADRGRIDALLCRQVNAVLHHPKFQELESAWRGLQMLFRAKTRHSDETFAEGGADVVLRVMDVSRAELIKDFDRARDETDNHLFRTVYDQEFGMPGGKPFGAIVSAHRFTNHVQDFELLANLARVGEASLCPILAGADPGLLGLDSFEELGKPINLQHIFDGPRHKGWERLRERPETQFLGLTLPRVLMRPPHRDDGTGKFGFRFEEDVRGRDGSKYLWGSAAFAMGTVLIRAFSEHRWFADIRGSHRQGVGGGMVGDLPALDVGTDSRGVALRPAVEVTVDDFQEAVLCENGLIPVADAKDSPYAVFYSNQSVHRPAKYDDEAATANARVAAMLQYVLCGCRVGHYLKVMMRDHVGTFASAMEMETMVSNWVHRYVSGQSASADAKAEYPLAKAKVDVQEVPGSPGKYRMELHLLPHYQLDQLTSTMSLTVRDVSLTGG